MQFSSNLFAFAKYFVSGWGARLWPRGQPTARLPGGAGGALGCRPDRAMGRCPALWGDPPLFVPHQCLGRAHPWDLLSPSLQPARTRLWGFWRCHITAVGGTGGRGGGRGAHVEMPPELSRRSGGGRRAWGRSIPALCRHPEAPRGPSPQGAELQGPRPGSPHTSGSRRVCRPAPGAMSAPPAALCGSDESQDDAESSGSAVRKPLT